jgi:hypothetical protein
MTMLATLIEPSLTNAGVAGSRWSEESLFLIDRAILDVAELALRTSREDSTAVDEYAAPHEPSSDDDGAERTRPVKQVQAAFSVWHEANCTLLDIPENRRDARSLGVLCFIIISSLFHQYTMIISFSFHFYFIIISSFS